MAKRANWRKIKRHRSYTVDEAARLFPVSKGTVRHWLKAGLPHMAERKPFLILGSDLIEFLQNRTRQKRKCKLDECYCFTCREAKRPALGMADLHLHGGKTGNLEALCETCSGLMFKRVSFARIGHLEGILSLTIKQAGDPMNDIPKPCLNDHLEKEQSR